MPLCTLHLIALHNTTPNPLSTFLSTLNSTPLNPLVVSRVIRWIILPTKISTEHLLARNIQWDLLLILPSTAALPSNLAKLVSHHWSVTAGVPSRLTNSFAKTNDALLHPKPSTTSPSPSPSSPSAPKKTTSSAQNLELSAELNTWIDSFLKTPSRSSTGAVSMFNLLAFARGKKAEYLKYGAAFAESIGSRHGGNAKIVGNVVGVNGATTKVDGSDWDEIALAHYPSIAHFRDMLASEDYQEVNHRYRVGSLRDTCILMTSEIAVEEVLGGEGRARL
ncbi:hypothetical protein E8E13_000710 [Curvularia kusanoi]|uniref:DUF1330 domain-containing protein n=1 Tax=Curvularia kusanoi TaxID=90978 RepID=A0A9P4T4A8_CURKU|nr:hypothetical protein E8E13_000710 [Curvularia kusanoi]